ncbi:HigB toxin protein [Nitratiruptor sp. YY08-26]|uniref:type II toxin-antitoxin system RelE/ParE family toxin n=1 Tax=unclassified Nitratiruptor TaxID=2624044 RepID=UPI001915F5F4|nr:MULTISPECIES: type II toxin-antitoxin system YafQ family toxin [unclassified Nitratiruptor]BCD62651.1 HigB toxin protein [Nitratiruptor sp. YY08-13]BCD66587.1 HigB toxin protein [Nitratiruptor sp. YY08-26]
MYTLIFTESYLKKEKRFIKKHPELKERYKKVLTILAADPHYPSLRLHKLQGKLKEYCSVSISMSYRIVIDLVITDKEIILLDIGSHDEVY